MKCTIVTISFNQVKFLERAIKSVIEQNYDDIEYIIVDPGSTDGSRDIIDRYQSQIDRIIFESDQGPADGLNKGFSYATGEILGYLNADDTYLPGAVRKAVQEFRSDPTTDAVYAHGYIVDEKGKVLRRFRSTAFDTWRYAYGGVSVMQQSTFFKHQAFLDVQGFNRDNHTCWDAELLLDFGLSGKRFKLVHDYQATFTIHSYSISGSGRMKAQYQQDRLRLLEKVIGRYPKWYDVMLRHWVRIEKWILNPDVLYFRVLEKIVGRPKLESL